MHLAVLFLRAAAFVLVAGSLLLILGIAVVRIPPQHSPFAPLDLERPRGWATGMQLARLRDQPESCLAVLDASKLKYTPIPDRSEGAFCGFRNAVVIAQTSVPFTSPVRVSCPMAAALYLWGRDVVEPAAERHFGSRVTAVRHFGTYACRRVYGRASGRPSQHATANAIDIAGFRLANGREVSVARGWGGSPVEQAFLREISSGGCRLFRSVLGPEYNAAHADHLHLDMGSYSICR